MVDAERLTARSARDLLPELLEKAIFTEETVGDLDAAMELYEQIVARTDSRWSSEQTAVSNALAFEATLRASWLVKISVSEAYQPRARE